MLMKSVVFRVVALPCQEAGRQDTVHLEYLYVCAGVLFCFDQSSAICAFRALAHWRPPDRRYRACIGLLVLSQLNHQVYPCSAFVDLST